MSFSKDSNIMVVAAVTEGLADVEAGRVQPHERVVKRMKTRFGGKAK